MEPLVAVELQLPATFCFYRLHRKMDGIQYKIDCLAGTGLVSDNASVIQITDHGQIENAFLGMNVRNVCDPLLIWMCSIEFTIQKVLVFVDLPAHLDPLSSAAYLTQKIVFVHDS